MDQTAPASSVSKKPKKLLKKLAILIILLGIVGSVAFGFYKYQQKEDSASDVEGCLANSSAKIVSSNNKIECTINGKTYTKEFKTTSIQNVVYKDDTIKFTYPSDWTVTKESSLSGNTPHRVLVASPFINGYLKSNGAQVQFKAFLSIDVYGPQNIVATACEGCEAKEEAEISLTKPTGSVWQIFSAVGIDKNTNLYLNKDRVVQGTKNHSVAIKLPSGNNLVLRENISIKTVDQNNKTTLVPIKSVDDFKNASAYLSSLSIIRSIEAK